MQKLYRGGRARLDQAKSITGATSHDRGRNLSAAPNGSDQGSPELTHTDKGFNPTNGRDTCTSTNRRGDSPSSTRKLEYCLSPKHRSGQHSRIYLDPPHFSPLCFRQAIKSRKRGYRLRKGLDFLGILGMTGPRGLGRGGNFLPHLAGPSRANQGFQGLPCARAESINSRGVYADCVDCWK